MKRKIISTILALSTLLSASSAVNAQGEIQVKLNGKAIEFDAPVQIVNNRTLVPMRAIFEQIGAVVAWNNGTINAAYKDKTITLSVNNPVANVSSSGITTEYILDTAPIIINDRTLVPVRFVSEQLGLEVNWSESENTVYLAKYEAPYAVMDISGYGQIIIELYPEYAPQTVENFITLAKSGFYNGLTYHRVIKDFMIQGGDPLGTGFGGSENTIKGEFIANGFNQNIISHTRGVISMARSQAYNSASSQFFIVHKDSPFLDGQYAAFGIVVSGIEVVDKITEVKTDISDKPLEDVVINSISIIEQ